MAVLLAVSHDCHVEVNLTVALIQLLLAHQHTHNTRHTVGSSGSSTGISTGSTTIITPRRTVFAINRALRPTAE